MTPVLHVSRSVADALPAGLSIAPVEGQRCPECGGYGWIAEPDPSTGEPINPQQCPTCRGDAVLPPVLSGRIAVAVDGAIIGTATAEEVLEVVDVDATCQQECVLIDREKDEVWLLRAGRDGEWQKLDADPPALGLSPGQWVVTIEDWAPTTDRCPGCWGIGQGEAVYHLSIDVGGLDYLPCDACDGEESCPPVPVAAAPVSTITTWEVT